MNHMKNKLQHKFTTILKSNDKPDDIAELWSAETDQLFTSARVVKECCTDVSKKMTSQLMHEEKLGGERKMKKFPFKVVETCFTDNRKKLALHSPFYDELFEISAKMFEDFTLNQVALEHQLEPFLNAMSNTQLITDRSNDAGAADGSAPAASGGGSTGHIEEDTLLSKNKFSSLFSLFRDVQQMRDRLRNQTLQHEALSGTTVAEADNTASSASSGGGAGGGGGGDKEYEAAQLRVAQIRNTEDTLNRMEREFEDKKLAMMHKLFQWKNQEHLLVEYFNMMIQSYQSYFDLCSARVEDSIHRIKELLERFKAPRAFSTSLQDFAVNQNRAISYVIEKCVNGMLRKNCMEEQGLFRISSVRPKIEMFKAALDVMQVDDNLMESLDNAVLANTLKEYLRSLKEPLLPCSLYSQMRDITTKIQKNKSNGDYDASAAIRANVIEQLPAAHLDNLIYLIVFLKAVTRHEAQNKMNASNLAIVIGPNVVAAPNSHDTSFFDVGLAIIEAMITHCDQIFPKAKLDEARKLQAEHYPERPFKTTVAAPTTAIHHIAAVPPQPPHFSNSTTSASNTPPPSSSASSSSSVSLNKKSQSIYHHQKPPPPPHMRTASDYTTAASVTGGSATARAETSGVPSTSSAGEEASGKRRNSGGLLFSTFKIFNDDSKAAVSSNSNAASISSSSVEAPQPCQNDGGEAAQQNNGAPPPIAFDSLTLPTQLRKHQPSVRRKNQAPPPPPPLPPSNSGASPSNSVVAATADTSTEEFQVKLRHHSKDTTTTSSTTMTPAGDETVTSSAASTVASSAASGLRGNNSAPARPSVVPRKSMYVGGNSAMKAPSMPPPPRPTATATVNSTNKQQEGGNAAS